MKALLLLLAFALALTGTARSQMSIDLIDNSVSWRFADEGSLPAPQSGKQWYDPAYNDTGSFWNSGVGPFGYGDTINYGANDYSSVPGPTAPAIHYGPDSANKYITTYFRAKFFIPAGTDIGLFPEQYNTLAFRTRVDDGFVVYVNGIEVQRYNLPAGTITNSTPAPAAIEALWKSYSVAVDFNGLVLNTGTTANVIAVEIHQAGGGSSDIIFEQELRLQNVPACEGLARPGIQERFNNAGDFGHFRGEVQADQSFETQDTDLSWQVVSVVPAGAFHPTLSTSIRGPEFGTALPYGNAFQFSGGELVWESEVVDIRDHKDIQFKARIQHMADPGATYSADERLSLEVMGSQDGVFFQPRRWWSTTGDITWTEIFGEAQPKKALVPTAANTPDNTGVSTNWRTLGFNDAAWKSGTLGVGYDNDLTGTWSYIPSDLAKPRLIGSGLDVKNEMNTKNTTCYVRVKFSVTNPAQYSQMRLRMKYDDGFVAYLNGVRIAESNYQPAGQTTKTYPPPWNSVASAEYGEANAFGWKDFQVVNVPGNPALTDALNTLSSSPNGNVLAIYCLNNGLTSSDVLCLPALDLGVGDPPSLSAQDLDDHSQATYLSIASPVDSPKLVPPGTNFVKLRISSKLANDKQLALDDVQVLGTPTAAVSYYSFMKVRFPALPDASLAATADLDGDGLSNIVEYGTGTDPGSPALRAPNPNNLLDQFSPEVVFLPTNKIRIRFRVPASTDLISPDSTSNQIGYTAGDLNIRPQWTFGNVGDNGALQWDDGVVGSNEFVPAGQPEEIGDGTNTQWVTMITPSPITIDKDNVFIRFRYGVVLPHYLKSGEACFQEF